MICSNTLLPLVSHLACLANHTTLGDPIAMGLDTDLSMLISGRAGQAKAGVV